MIKIGNELAREVLERLFSLHPFDEQGAARGREMGCLTCSVMAEFKDEVEDQLTRRHPQPDKPEGEG